MQSVPEKIQDGVCPHFVSRRRQTDIRPSRVLRTSLRAKVQRQDSTHPGPRTGTGCQNACRTVSETRIIVRMPDQHSRTEPQCGSPRMRLTHQPRADSPTPAIGSHGEWRNAQRRCASDAVGNDDRCEQHMSHNPVALLGNERQFGNERRSTPQPRYQQVLRMVADRKIAESRLHQSLDPGPVRSLFLSDNHRRTCIKMKASGPFPDKRGGSDAANGCNVPKVN